MAVIRFAWFGVFCADSVMVHVQHLFIINHNDNSLPLGIFFPWFDSTWWWSVTEKDQRHRIIFYVVYMILQMQYGEYVSHDYNGNNGKFEWNFGQNYNFQTDFSDWWLRHLLWNCPNMNVTGLHWWSVNIGSGNGLVQSGNKPSPGPIYFDHNELNTTCTSDTQNLL